jgi:hypothetical protein
MERYFILLALALYPLVGFGEKNAQRNTVVQLLSPKDGNTLYMRIRNLGGRSCCEGLIWQDGVLR